VKGVFGAPHALFPSALTHLPAFMSHVCHVLTPSGADVMSVLSSGLKTRTSSMSSWSQVPVLKGRVAVPIQFREALSGLQQERLVATKFRISTYRCLDVYPFSAWQRLESRLFAKGSSDPRYVRFRNVYVSGAHLLMLDAQGRVLLPPLLREYAGIARDVMITGDVDKFRIWDQQIWQRAFSEHEDQVPDDEPA
jgi:MraZ protein